LVNGSFATIGNLSELRKKYEDYLIVIDEDAKKSVDDIERVIKSLFPRAKIDTNPEYKGLVFRVIFKFLNCI